MRLMEDAEEIKEDAEKIIKYFQGFCKRHVLGSISNLAMAYIANNDIHALKASEMFGVPVDAVTDELRYKAKQVNFGQLYNANKRDRLVINEYGLTTESKQNLNKHILLYKILRLLDSANCRISTRNLNWLKYKILTGKFTEKMAVQWVKQLRKESR